jgi:potassium efflux system protein
MSNLFQRYSLPLQTLLVFSLWLVCGAVPAQESPVGTPGAESRPVIEQQIARVEASTELAEDLKGQLLERYRKALAALDTSSEHTAKAEEYAATAKAAPERLKAIAADLEAAAKKREPLDEAALRKLPLADLERQLLQEQSALGLEDNRIAELKTRVETLTAAPAKARERIPEVQRELDDLRAAGEVQAPAGEAEELTRARATLRAARMAALQAELRMLDQTILTAPIRAELRTAERDVAAERIEAQRQRVRALETLVNERRVAEAESAQAKAEEAQQQTAGKHPVLDDIARRNAELGAHLRDTAQALERVTAAVAERAELAKRLEADFESTKQKIELAGLSQALGQALRERQRSLPDVRALRRLAADREKLIADATLEQIRARDERAELKALDDAVDRLLAGSDAPDGELRPELRTLLQSRLDLLDRSVATQDAYIRALTDLEFNERKLMGIASSYDDFLAERLLWIRSTAPVNADMLAALPSQLSAILSPANWFGVWEAWVASVLDQPAWLIPILAFAVLLWRRRRILAALTDSATRLGKPTTDSIFYTVKALALTLLAAVPWAILSLSVGYQLRLSPEASDFAKAVGQGLSWLPAQIFFLESFRTLCHPSGLGAAHFRWPAAGLHYLRRQIAQLIAVFVPATFLAVTLFNYFHLVGIASIVIVVVVELALALFFYRVMNPSGPLLESYVQRNPGSLIVKLRVVWFAVSVLWPLALAVYAAMGYVYAAGRLTGLLIETFWFVLALVVVHAFAVRWLLVTRRRLAYKAAVERREAARKAAAAAAADGGERSALDDLRTDLEEPQIDLAAMDVETRKLLSLGIVIALVVGLYVIWSAVLPAFNILERVELWSHTVSVAGQDVVQAITLRDVLLAFAIGLATAILTRSMPTFVEIVLLQRFAVSPGSRYAITTLMGYVIAAVGVIWAFNVIGANWSQLQWLVAALGVGIGFGLQEIVANFISGLIILFERPIRVGDWVTVGDTDGIVTRIQIRATTIRNWDRKELLVPNKEFITGRLLNWSLSDNVTRVVIKVGIAYGSDVELALKLLEESATEHALVLKDPPPLVTFDAFGDSSLDLTLRLYLESLDQRLLVTSAVNRAIMRKFHAAGISIPFPQRDVHLDTTRPIDVRLHREAE